MEETGRQSLKTNIPGVLGRELVAEAMSSRGD